MSVEGGGGGVGQGGVGMEGDGVYWRRMIVLEDPAGV